jgi:hypothetical protein
MPLGLLLTLVIGGIAGIALALHLLGLSRQHRFDDAADAARAWDRECPEDPALRVTLSHDRHAALIETARGHGIVWPMGADTTARDLSGARITRTRAGLRIDLPDFTAPHVHLHLDAAEADRWPQLMTATGGAA